MSTTEETTPSALITPAPTSAMDSKLANDIQRFTKGFELNAKIIGLEDVKQESGDEICKTSMIKLKAVALANLKANKIHKQKVTLKLTLDGIEIYDRLTHVELYKHSVTRISYISRDPSDSRAIGYIYKNSASEFQYIALKTEKEAQETFVALKDLFETVLETQKRGRAESLVAAAAVTGTDTATLIETSNAQIMNETVAESNEVISGLEEKIKQMNEQPSMNEHPSLVDFNAEPDPAQVAETR